MQDSEFKEKQLHDKLVTNLFKTDLIEHSDFGENEYIWYNLLLCLVMNNSLSSAYLEKYETRLNEIWDSIHDPQIKVMIYEEYTNRGLQTNVLEHRFAELQEEMEILYDRITEKEELLK